MDWKVLEFWKNVNSITRRYESAPLSVPDFVCKEEWIDRIGNEISLVNPGMV